MNIQSVVVHRIIKQANSVSSLQLASHELSLPNVSISTLIENLDGTYNSRTPRAYGSFDEDEVTYTFQPSLRNYYDSTNDFLTFTSEAMGRLKTIIDSINLATGSEMLFVRYTTNASDYLLIVMLKNKESRLVDDQLQVLNVTHIDEDQLNAVARINLGLWNSAGHEKYISFTKKGGSAEISDYFIRFIGCTEYVKNKELTDDLVNAIRKYADLQDDDEEKRRIRKMAFDHCIDAQSRHKQVDLAHLSTALNPHAPEEFTRFLSDNDYNINNNFTLDKKIFNKLQRFSYSDSSLRLSFDRDYFTNNMNYDAMNATLTITNLSENLKSLLNELRED